MFILASKSPRRKEILSKIIKDFEIIEAHIDERSVNLPAYQLSYDLCKRKAYDVFSSHLNDVVIACDTIVVYKGEIFNKPADEKDAYRMLKTLSNNHHIVLSSYTIISKDFEINKTVRSDVYFNDLSDELITSYIKSGSPMDKAGAYGIQDNEKYPLIKKIIGSFDNIKGLPIEDLTKDLKRLKLI